MELLHPHLNFGFVLQNVQCLVQPAIGSSAYDFTITMFLLLDKSGLSLDFTWRKMRCWGECVVLCAVEWEQGAAPVCILLLWMAKIAQSRIWKGSASSQLMSVSDGVLQEIRVKHRVDAEEYILLWEKFHIFVGVAHYVGKFDYRCKFTTCM